MMFQPRALSIDVAECRALLDDVKTVNPNLISNRYNFTVISLFYSMVEIADSINILCLASASVGVPILARSFLECSMDFLNLINDRSYEHRIESNYLKEWLSYLNAAANHSSGQAFTSPEWVKFKEDKEQDKQRLKTEGNYKTIKIQEKFRIANSLEYYDVIYRQLCCSSHNNLREVYVRAIRHDPLGQGIKDVEADITHKAISIALQEASKNLHVLFNWKE